jgi:hypothetical protein
VENIEFTELAGIPVHLNGACIATVVFEEIQAMRLREFVGDLRHQHPTIPAHYTVRVQQGGQEDDVTQLLDEPVEDFLRPDAECIRIDDAPSVPIVLDGVLVALMPIAELDFVCFNDIAASIKMLPDYFAVSCTTDDVALAIADHAQPLAQATGTERIQQIDIASEYHPFLIRNIAPGVSVALQLSRLAGVSVKPVLDYPAFHCALVESSSNLESRDMSLFGAQARATRSALVSVYFASHIALAGLPSVQGVTFQTSLNTKAFTGEAEIDVAQALVSEPSGVITTQEGARLHVRAAEFVLPNTDCVVCPCLSLVLWTSSPHVC